MRLSATPGSASEAYQVAVDGVGTCECPLQDVQVDCLVFCNAGVGAEAKVNQNLGGNRTAVRRPCSTPGGTPISTTGG